ncbi:MAG TPA: potassium transporter [Candidatus Cloacimonas sp.]|jgi:trk system potassium uptake protein TrkA|nr:trk/ktr system potassium uptake protein [Candidatus Cloacimonadota bacterium]HCX73418.1 potassium transporter [Candidatus Cloacimonas sp.]
MARFAVIGLGKFGKTVATTLYENGAEVIAIDNDEKLIEEVTGLVSSPIHLNSTDETALRQHGIQDMDAVVLAIGNNIEVSVLTSVILKKLGISNIYAKVDSKVHARILRLLGIQNIIFPEEQIGTQLANSLISSNILEYIDLSSGHVIIDMVVPEEWVGKTLQELALPTKKGVNVVAIKYKAETVTEEGENEVENKINDMPGANDRVNEGDILVLIGPKNRINKLIKETEGKA